MRGRQAFKCPNRAPRWAFLMAAGHRSVKLCRRWTDLEYLTGSGALWHPNMHGRDRRERAAGHNSRSAVTAHDLTTASPRGVVWVNGAKPMANGPHLWPGVRQTGVKGLGLHGTRARSAAR
jgi:hypothetical protein